MAKGEEHGWQKPTERIISLKKKTLDASRFLSIEQAKIITRIYRENEDLPVIMKRALALSEALCKMSISIDPEELIVGNRTPDIRAGVVFPEAGITWLINEIDSLPSRPQDTFNVRSEDKIYFKEVIEPYWKGKTLEDNIYGHFGEPLSAIEKVVKINQKDHAQGHICPDVEKWLRFGPAGLKKTADEYIADCTPDKAMFYKSVSAALNASCKFIKRYSELAFDLAAIENNSESKKNLKEIAEVCDNLSKRPPETFREAIQSVWFLFVILQMESNASSFSPGRIDQYLYQYYISDIKSGKTDQSVVQELIDALFIKFNHIVYMRNSHSAKYFAGFPIGFNVTIGGQSKMGEDATNELSYMLLKAQDHVRLPQPNLTARLHKGSPADFIKECTRIIGLGTGMPQIANDESIIPSLKTAGIEIKDALDYALVGCVELTTQGNFLGWSDAAMFNLVKVLELTMNNGKCMLTGRQLGLETGYLFDFLEFGDFDKAFKKQINHFILKMTEACEVVEKFHQTHLPSPFLSSVVNDCLVKGLDVTAGGAKYNYSGIQAIQVANIADSIAVLKKLVFDKEIIGKKTCIEILRRNYEGNENIRQQCLNLVPKYGNDIQWVDEYGEECIMYFADKLSGYKNYRGGKYHMGLYTVSAHVPMGQNVAATPDGRLSGTPLADGGLSPMYGRDTHGPTAVLNSVSRIPSERASNGTLLNMKFLPSFFKNEHDRDKFSSFLRTFISLPIHHVQFNVVTNEELIKAKAEPESYRGLTVRVAGYTAYFTELSEDLQDEIISRTTYGNNI
ncbi:MAG: formate C-acetyltransferase/glycerol dehydratase family glycyl radical enzyme [Bacteroidales bacterium]|nr:formate C-acetyltransferase/glycerol dehydratase family glycyl radical enzyme [Bacteroidales bacterium]